MRSCGLKVRHPATSNRSHSSFISSTRSGFAAKEYSATSFHVQRLDHTNDGFVATAADGERLHAIVSCSHPVSNISHVPTELRSKLPKGRNQRTCEFVEFSEARNKRFLIIGGRESAFEWAALLLDAGAAAVHLSHRHPSPAFAEAEWSWIGPLVDGMVENPNWFRRLSEAEREAISHRHWAEGRLKVEPWLAPRLNDARVTVWPNTELVSCIEDSNGELAARLTNGENLIIDHVVLATGYKVDIGRVPLLAAGNILDRLETRNGFPVLDEHLETSVPGLFITSMPAMQDFGPFFGFTVSVRTSAKLISERLLGTHSVARK